MGKTSIQALPTGAREKLPDRLLFLGYRGSESHGLKLPPADPHSTDDIDLMGVYIGPPSHYIGFGGEDTKEFWVGEYDVVLYELRKFFLLLLKSNPNVLGTLWLPNEYIILDSPEWWRIVGGRHLFASKEAYNSFAGYANGQFHRMARQTEETPEIRREIRLMEEELDYRERKEPESKKSPTLHKNFSDWSAQKLRTRRNDLKGQRGYMGEKRKHLVEQYGFDTKNAGHLIRLLHMAAEFLADGEMRVDRRGIDDKVLLEIKRGEWPLEWVVKASEAGFKEAKLARDDSPLQEKPDRVTAEHLLMELVRTSVC